VFIHAIPLFGAQVWAWAALAPEAGTDIPTTGRTAATMLMATTKERRRARRQEGFPASIPI
jgi:hypothetical protein